MEYRRRLARSVLRLLSSERSDYALSRQTLITKQQHTRIRSNHPSTAHYRCHATTFADNVNSPPSTRAGRRRKLQSNADTIRFRKDNVLIDPVQEINRLVEILSHNKDDQDGSSSSSSVLPPSLIDNRVIAVLMHLAMNPRKDGGPMASRLIDAIRNTSQSVALSVQIYHLVIECWIKSRVKDGINPAEHLLRELLNRGRVLLHQDMIVEDINRVNSSFALVVHTLLRINDEQSLAKANALIQRIRSRFDNVKCGLKPNVTAMNAILNALCHSTDANSARESKMLLQEMVETHKNDATCNMEPNMTSFAVAIHHLAKVGDILGAKDMLKWMVRLHDEGVVSAKPDIYCFNSFLDGLGKSNSRTAAEEIEDILAEMEEIGGDLRPDRLSYTCCIHAHARMRDAEKSEHVLRRMIAAYEAGNEDARPDATAFGACVDAWAQFGGLDGAERAEALVSLQEELHRGGSTDDVAPTVVLYNMLIKAWAHSNTRKSGEKAANVLQRMVAFDIEPNTTTINAILTALARSGSGETAVDKAETILKQMEKSGAMSLDVITYNSYLDCLARNSATNATKRVEDTLIRMGKHDTSPNTRTYNTAMNLLARSGDADSAQRASAILETMEASGDENIRPDARSYGAAINAWARSSEPKRAEMALDIYKRIKQPSIAAANAVLSACCFVPNDEKENAVRIAFNVMNQSKQGSNSINADHITYSTMLKVIGTGVAPGGDRDEMIKAVFEACCKEGHVSELVLRTLTKSASRCFLNVLIPTSEASLPREWSRNIAQRRSR